jgi:hypothetical protein
LQILKLKRYYEHTREKCHGWIDWLFGCFLSSWESFTHIGMPPSVKGCKNLWLLAVRVLLYAIT